MIVNGDGWELRLGRWQDVLCDAVDSWDARRFDPAVPKVDAVITDAPFSGQTHDGHNAGTELAKGAVTSHGHPLERRTIDYDRWDAGDVAGCVSSLSTRCRGWFVALCDDVLAPIWRAELLEANRLAFAPLAFVQPGSRVRLAGDGPSCWVTWIVVARPRNREMAVWGTLPGSYVLPRGMNESKARGAGRAASIVGAKPLWLMRALVRHYSRRGDLIVDPCAGSGTTLLAAVIEGRRAIGAELDPKTFELAVARLRQPYTQTMAWGD